jgi:hypothetical protein
MQRTGAEYGIKFSYDGKIGNTINSHRLVEFAKRQGKQNEMVEALMKGYFEESNIGLPHYLHCYRIQVTNFCVPTIDADVSDIVTLVTLAGKAGVNTEEVWLSSI